MSRSRISSNPLGGGEDACHRNLRSFAAPLRSARSPSPSDVRRDSDQKLQILYEMQLCALSDAFPHANRYFYLVYKSAPPSFHAEYILGRILSSGARRDVVSKALRYPLCARDVFDALCRHPNWPLQDDVSEFPERLFRHLTHGPSEWTEHDHPSPFLKYL